MSGTSLDGLDIVYGSFIKQGESWHYDIIRGRTVEYSDELRSRLVFNPNISAYDLKVLDLDLGTWMGAEVKKFRDEFDITPEYIASHGHTWFHEPAKRLNYQIGDGYELYRLNRIPVVNDFRSFDIRFGGQGAPLVPIGDHLLFDEYDCCLNLGGIANASGMRGGKRVSYDITPFNLVLNRLAQQLGMPYDDGGKKARNGQLIEALLKDLSALSYFNLTPPKSLGIEWLNETIYPLLANYQSDDTADLLRTFVHFTANQIADGLGYFDHKSSVLVTGGGAYNDFFVELLTDRLEGHSKVILPAKELIDFKEALVFAFLGLLRLENKVNCLKDVTGAIASVSGGMIYNQKID